MLKLYYFRCDVLAIFTVQVFVYLSIIPRARMGSETIAHEGEGRMGYSDRGHKGERSNCFSKNPTSSSKKISRQNFFH